MDDGDSLPELRDLFNQQSEAHRKVADTVSESSDLYMIANNPYMDVLASEFEEKFRRTTSEIAAISSFGKQP